MEGPDGIDMGTAIGPTQRGSLWRASRDREHDRIVRIVDPRFCDERFKRALRNLRQRQYPRMLKIASEGWSGAQYYIEYEADRPWQTFEERLAECDGWWDRLSLLVPVCETVSLWQRSPVFPLGLNLRQIVLVSEAGQQFPWLVPCPAIVTSSPCDLFGLDSTVMAALAPEKIRGVPSNERAQDAYALGTLAAQAAGCPESRSARDDESRVETQARGALLVSTGAGSMVEPAVLATGPMKQLFRNIQRYRHTAPEARPQDAAELRSALVTATDPGVLAEAFWPTDPGRALELLDDAVWVAPERIDLRRQRCDARWRMFQAASGDISDDDVELLLRDIKVLKALDPSAGAMPYLRAAEIHRRRGDLILTAEELYEATQADPADLQALLLYGQCWTDLGRPDDAAKVAGVARRRIGGMVAAGLITGMEGQRWNDKFDRLSG